MHKHISYTHMYSTAQRQLDFWERQTHMTLGSDKYVKWILCGNLKLPPTNTTVSACVLYECPLQARFMLALSAVYNGTEQFMYGFIIKILMLILAKYYQ